MGANVGNEVGEPVEIIVGDDDVEPIGASEGDEEGDLLGLKEGTSESIKHDFGLHLPHSIGYSKATWLQASSNDLSTNFFSNHSIFV